MDGPFTRCREPFTPSQWLDLELQALIYKYIVANVPVPSHLLFQIRKSLNPFLYAGSLTGSYAPKSCKPVYPEYVFHVNIVSIKIISNLFLVYSD